MWRLLDKKNTLERNNFGSWRSDKDSNLKHEIAIQAQDKKQAYNKEATKDAVVVKTLWHLEHNEIRHSVLRSGIIDRGRSL